MPYSAALPDVNPVQAHQQGMSPNTASAAAAADVQNAVMATGNQEADGGVAVRTMAVAVATGQPGGTPNWPAMEASPSGRLDGAHEQLVGTTEHSFGQMNAAQASWSMMTTRRTTPAWIQRLGAFFHEMRTQQTGWPPSPLGSPPTRHVQSSRGSPEGEQRGWGSPVLLSPEQQEQFRRMEQRAPLLYGPPRGERQLEGNGSSGGSTYEAVQEEVKRQLRGVVSQLEASKREAQDLRQEVELLRAERERVGHGRQLEDMTMPEGPPVTLGGYLVNNQAEQEGGPTARSSTGARSGVQTAMATTGASGLCAGSTTTGASGLCAGSATTGASGLMCRICYHKSVGLMCRIFYYRGVGLTSKA